MTQLKADLTKQKALNPDQKAILQISCRNSRVCWEFRDFLQGTVKVL